MKETLIIQKALYLSEQYQKGKIKEDFILCDNKEVESFVKRRLYEINTERFHITSSGNTYRYVYKNGMYFFINNSNVKNLFLGINKIRVRTLDYSKLYIKQHTNIWEQKFLQKQSRMKH